MSAPTALATEHLHGFLGSLTAGPQKRADFLLAVVASPPASVDELYWRARVTLVSRAEEIAGFDAVFDAWFRGGRLLAEERAAGSEEADETAAPRPGGEGELDATEWGEGAGRHASADELAGGRTFASASGEGREQLEALTGALEAALPAVRARRMRRSRRGRVVDGRAVMRGAHRTGGEVARLSWLRRPQRLRRVLVLIDVSGSLRTYTPDLLRFAHAVLRAADRGEAFTFGTRLTRVTRELRSRDVDRALERVSARVPDADGGTRIGAALETFLANGRYVAAARGALVIVLSDGLERGDPSAMAAAVGRLGQLGHRLVWWSPLACEPGYRPVTRGMAAILGSLDELAGACDLPTLLEPVRRLPATCAGPRRTAAREWR